MRKVFVIGPSSAYVGNKSTGKTTLVDALARRLGLVDPAVVREVARDVMKRHGFNRENVGTLEMQQAIMIAHLDKEDEGRTCPIQICDRSAVDPLVYAILTAKSRAEARERRNIIVNSTRFQHALKVYRQSTFLLLVPVAEWLIDDGIRLLEHQTQCFKEFQNVLRELEIDFREIGPTMKLLEERITFTLGLLKL